MKINISQEDDEALEAINDVITYPGTRKII